MTETIDTRVRLVLYREFVEKGRAPTSRRIAELLEMPVEEARAAMERLAAGRVIALQPESREIMIAAPLSNVPTPYVVRADHSYFGACVWDALRFGHHCDAPDGWHAGNMLSLLRRSDGDRGPRRRPFTGAGNRSFRGPGQAMVGKHRIHMKDHAALS